MRKIFFVISLKTLVFGTFIYLLFRVSTLKIFSWLNYLGIDFLNFKFRIKMLKYTPHIPKWFIFSLPDGLWVFSYVTLMISVWNFTINKQSFFWICIIPIIAIFSEIFQIFQFVSGTFDIIDLLFYILGFILPFIFFKKQLTYKFFNYEQ